VASGQLPVAIILPSFSNHSAIIQPSFSHHSGSFSHHPGIIQAPSSHNAAIIQLSFKHQAAIHLEQRIAGSAGSCQRMWRRLWKTRTMASGQWPMAIGQ
jgi:hypothetical protein